MGKFTLGNSREQVMKILPEGNIKVTQLGAKRVCVVRSGEKVFAFEQWCPHRGAPLKDGHINGFEEIICPLHSFRFDLNTGQLASGGGCGDLVVYKTNLTEGGLEIVV